MGPADRRTPHPALTRGTSVRSAWPWLRSLRSYRRLRSSGSSPTHRWASAMHTDAVLQSITAVYAVCNSLRLVSYVPQIVAVVRETSGAHAISIASWVFWMVSHAITAVYGRAVLNDPLLAWMMWGNAAGCLAIAALTVAKRLRYGWVRPPSDAV